MSKRTDAASKKGGQDWDHHIESWERTLDVPTDGTAEKCQHGNLSREACHDVNLQVIVAAEVAAGLVAVAGPVEVRLRLNKGIQCTHQAE